MPYGTIEVLAYQPPKENEMMVCKCEYLIHEPNRGWRSGYDLTMKAMSFRGAPSRAIFKSMVATMRQYALTGK